MRLNNLVQITLNADQEKYNIDGDASITFIDATSYYVGRIAARHHGWITLESVDQDGNHGGVVFIKEDQVAKIEDSTPTLHYYSLAAPHDPFHMKQLNAQVLNWDFTNIRDLLLNAADSQPFITLETKTGVNYTGLIMQLDKDEVRILEKNDQTLEQYATVIPLADIVCIDINSIDNRLFTHYLKQHKNYDNDLGLSEIYFDYTFDDQFGSFAIGKVLKYADENLILESLNDLGQVESIGLIARSHIAHVIENSERLNYFNYLVDWQKKNGSFDPDHLEHSVNLQGEIKSIAEVIEEWPEGKVIKISDSIYHYPDRLGLISSYNDNGFDLKIATEYATGDISDHEYEDLISIDLAGSEMIRMQKFLDSRN